MKKLGLTQAKWEFRQFAENDVVPDFDSIASKNNNAIEFGYRSGIYDAIKLIEDAEGRSHPDLWELIRSQLEALVK